ncbi:Hypothetical_protein [Hexamita inflata]|uniref:Hypothetical_protein n=1 Tax=Hexamita inflata TaxID=28002 RepID=A0AA86PNN9_9EUKA|nr:Hypothetical protein HINF_LOCUS29623 [Hexamita inflata]
MYIQAKGQLITHKFELMQQFGWHYRMHKNQEGPAVMQKGQFVALFCTSQIYEFVQFTQLHVGTHFAFILFQNRPPSQMVVIQLRQIPVSHYGYCICWQVAEQIFELFTFQVKQASQQKLVDLALTTDKSCQNHELILGRIKVVIQSQFKRTTTLNKCISLKFRRIKQTSWPTGRTLCQNINQLRTLTKLYDQMGNLIDGELVQDDPDQIVPRWTCRITAQLAERKQPSCTAASATCWQINFRCAANSRHISG